MKIVFFSYTVVVSILFYFLLKNFDAQKIYLYSQESVAKDYKSRYFRLLGQPKTIIITKENKSIETIYIPVEGKVEIINNKIKIKSFGLTSRLGLQLSTFPVLWGVDMKVVYWNRLGLNLGYLDKGLTVTMSYKLDKVPFITNTELFVGSRLKLYQQSGMWIGGFRINL